MPRNRIITQCEAVYCSTGTLGATGYMLLPGGTGTTNGGAGTTNLVAQLHRIQSANYSANVTRTDINQFGQLSALDRIILQSPTVSMNLDYIVANTYNANVLGFTTDGSAGMLSGILTKTTDEKNYFVSTVREGQDAINDTFDADSTKFTIGIGNGFITNFTAAGSVGNFATESVTVEGLNLATYVGSTGLLSPAIVPSGGQRVTSPNNFSLLVASSGVAGSVAALRPGDITMTIQNPVLGPVVSDLKIQSYNLSIPIARQPLQKLGSPFPFSREIQFPVNVTLSIQAELGDLGTGDISSLYCNDVSQGIQITLRKPQCGGGGPVGVQYTITGAKLESQSYTSAIGQNKRVDLQYVSTIGGPADQTSNVIYSGSYT